MKFSLILCTLNRVSELERFMSYLTRQTYRHFEVILVDQNEDDRLKPIIDHYQDINHIHYFKVNFKGLSRARNEGLKHITGDIVAFPDDDCWYEDASLLEKVQQLFIQYPNIDGFTGQSKGHPSIRWPNKDCFISKNNIFSTAISFTIFLKSSAIRIVGLFDENLGVGAGTFYGSGEETEYLLRALLNGLSLLYSPQILVQHPPVKVGDNDSMTMKAYSYGVGLGYLLRKYHFPFVYQCRCLLRPFLGTCLFLFLKPARAKYYWSIFLGRLKGLRCSI